MESRATEIELEETDHHVLGRFRLWVYQRKLLDEGENLRDDKTLPFYLLFGLYVFGDIRGIPALQYFVIDTTIAKMKATNSYPLGQSVQWAYDNLPPQSPLIRLLFDIYCRLDDPIQAFGTHEHRDSYSKDFLWDFLIAYMREKDRQESMNIYRNLLRLPHTL